MMNSDVIEIYTDGACSGNPGPGGHGIVMKYKDQRKELAYGFKLTTNNRMELIAIIVVVALLIAVSLIIYNRFRLTQRQKHIIEEQKSIIEHLEHYITH